MGVAAWVHGSCFAAPCRQVAALLASANILLLMSANLVGFVVGVEGIAPLLLQVSVPQHDNATPACLSPYACTVIAPPQTAH